MKCLELIGASEFRVAEKPQPKPADDEVLLRIHACGICGSDVHGMDGSTGRRIPPVVMGHEAAGEVILVGASVTDYQQGDRVTFDSTLYCEDCDYCDDGRVNLCDTRKVFGVSCSDYKLNGAFAEYLTVPSRLLYRLPENLPYTLAALAEPVGVALHAIQSIDPISDRSVAVYGAGMIGLLIVLALKEKGVRTVHAIDIDPLKLELAIKFGADFVHDPNSPDFSHLQEIDASIEVVGITPTIQSAIKAVKKGGKVVLVGNVSPEVTLPLQEVVTREISIFGSCAIAGEYPDALDLIQERSSTLEHLITSTVPLEEAADWFHRLASGEKNLFKIIVNPTL